MHDFVDQNGSFGKWFYSEVFFFFFFFNRIAIKLIYVI
jgi:hypothetical protein